MQLQGCKLANVEIRWQLGTIIGLEFRDDPDRNSLLLESLLSTRDNPAQMLMSLLRSGQTSKEQNTQCAGTIASFVQATARRAYP